LSDYSNQKGLQRKAGISARKGLDSSLAANYSRAIAKSIVDSFVYAKAETILSYQPFGGEVDVSFFNERAALDAKKVAFPICHDNGKLVAALPYGPEAWEVGKYGIRSPMEGKSRILTPAEIDLVIVPCTAFHGARRMRVGMGAGYYDRYLPQCKKAVSVAVAYEAQQISDLCVDEWDVPLDYIVTERDVYCGHEF
jgi:5-formyltetrahydrofolate cyclo-ligase